MQWSQTRARERMESAEKETRFWRLFRLKNGVAKWHEYSSKRSAKTKLIRKAIMWMQGSIMMKVFFNWTAFVEHCKAMRRAVNMWRQREVRRCYWAWCNYHDGRKEKERLCR